MTWFPRPKVDYLRIPLVYIDKCSTNIDSELFKVDPGSIFMAICKDTCIDESTVDLEGSGIYS